MKVLRVLIRIDTALLALFGLEIGFSYSHTLTRYTPDGQTISFVQDTSPLAFLGTSLAVLAVVLFLVSDFALIGHRRKLGLWLAAGNLAIGLVALSRQDSMWGGFIGWQLGLLLLALAAALAWAGLRPLKPREATAELAAFQIPDDIRQALLRQVREAAAQEERNRLARDLHDSIKQQLFSINVGTATAQERWERDPEGARAALQDVRKSARAAMVEMQALLHQLRPEALGSIGLIEALREQCEALGFRTGAEVSLEFGETIPDDRLPPGAQETLFRISQEALGNVARHARARRVRVWLGLDQDSALLRVEDDGQGFDPGEERPGMGLRNLRERTESLRGTLEIASAPGAGTTMAVRIPLALPPPEASPLEKAMRQRWGEASSLTAATVTWMIRPLLPSDRWVNAVVGGLFVLSLVVTAIESKRRLRSIPETLTGASPGVLAHLRYLTHRDCALAFLLAAGWAPWSWRLGKVADTWAMVWLVVALLCMGLTAVELARFHHASELRSRWWRVSRWHPALGGWIFLGAFAYVFFFILMLKIVVWWQFDKGPEGRPLEPAEILFLLLGAAVLLYIRSRQPRREEV